MLFAWRITAIDDLLYSGSKVHYRLKGFDGKDLYFRNAMVVEVLEDFMSYRVETESDREKYYVDRTVMDLARLDAWISCVVRAMYTGFGRGLQIQLLF